MESKIAHLTFIQDIIKRMGSNSFLLKGWSITVIAALFALASQGANNILVIIAYLPALMFWGLDSFFLHQEKLFRKLYEKVAENEVLNDTFTLDTSPYQQEVDIYSKVLFSKTLLSFHGVIALIITLVMISLFS